MKSKKSLARYKKNPFIQNMVIEKANKSIRINAMGSENNVLVNQDTGEMSSTHVIAHKKVDATKFVKIFTSQIALTFDLNPCGLKALNVLFWVVQNHAIQKDEVYLDKHVVADFLESHKKLRLSMTTFSRGINQLEESQIIAKTMKRCFYYINPNFIFNGDRVAFTTLIERA